MVGDRLLGLDVRQAVEAAGVRHHPRAGVSLGHGGGVQVALRRLNHHDDLQPVFLRELEIALIVGRHRHDGSRAVGHQRKIGGVDGHPAAIHGVEAEGAGENALLFVALQGLVGAVLAGDPLDKCQDLGLLGFALAQLRHQGVLRRQAHEGRPAHGVLTRGEDRDEPLPVLERETDLRAGAAADPVLLHGNDFFGPPGQLVAVYQQVLGVARDPEEPLRELFLAHRLAAAPAGSGLHLLVGEHRLAGIAPVDVGLLAEGQPLFVHLQEQPLLPTVVLRPAGGDLPLPVVAEPQALELGAHVGDVGIRPLRRVGLVGDGGIFSRHAEGVPSHGVQHVEPAHALVACHHVADGVIAHVAHVDVPGGIGEHLQQVILGAAFVLGDPEQVLGLPPGLPLTLDHLRLVLFFHMRLRFP